MFFPRKKTAGHFSSSHPRTVRRNWIHSTPWDPEFIFKPFRSFQSGDNYSNPELDTLLDKAKGTIDKEERKAIYCEVEKLINDDCVVAVIAFWALGMGVHDHVKGVWIDHAGDPWYDEVWLDK